MKKVLLLLFVLLFVVSCSKKVVEEPEPEPIGYGTKLYIDTDKNSGIYTTEDLVGKVIGYQNIIDSDEIQYTIDSLLAEGITEDQLFLTGSYRDYPELIKKGTIDAWIVSDTTYHLIKDYWSDFEYSDFVHIGDYTMPIYEEKQKDQTIINDDLYTKPFSIMLTGIDQRVDPDQNSKALNDVNLMMVVDPVHNHILTVSFPRDSYLYSPTLGHSRKMTEIGPIARDVNAIKEAVGNVLDIEIPYYIQTSFSGFVDFIGYIGGVWVDVPMDMRMNMDSYRDVSQPYELKKGYTKLFGEWALALARNRKYNGIHGGDYGRIRNQCLIVDGIIDKIITYPEVIEWAHMDWYLKYVAAFNFTDDQVKVLYSLADKFHEEGYTIDNYFIENIGGMTDYGASVGYVTDYSKEIAKGKINLVLNGEIDRDNPYYEDIMIGNVTGGANQEEYIRNEYDLHDIYFPDTIEESDDIATEEVNEESVE